MSSALAGPKKDGRAYAVMVRSGVLLLAHASPDGVGGPYTGRGQYTTPDTREKAPGVWRLRTLDRRERPAPLCQGSADACSSWVRAALPPSSAACVPCRRVSGSVEPHQDKMGMHTTLLIHFAQHRHTRHHTRLSTPCASFSMLPVTYAMMERTCARRPSTRQGGDAVDFVAVVDQVIALLRQRGRVTYRTLQRAVSAR